MHAKLQNNKGVRELFVELSQIADESAIDHAASDCASQIASLTSSLPHSEGSYSFAASVYESLSRLVNGTIAEQRTSLFLMKHLCDVEFDESLFRVPQFLAKLMTILRNNPYSLEMCVIASEIVGLVISVGGPPCADATKIVLAQTLTWIHHDLPSTESLIIDSSVHREADSPKSVNLRQSSTTSHSLAGVVLCRSVAGNAPILFLPHLQTLLHNDLLALLLSPNLEVREQTCLTIEFLLSKFISNSSDENICLPILSFVQNASSFPQEIHLHAALLATRALVLSVPEFSVSHFGDIMGMVDKMRNSKIKKIQNLAISLLPLVANVSPQIFNEMYLKTAVDILFSALKKSETKANSFAAIGLLVVLYPNEFRPLMVKLMPLLKESLIDRAKKKAGSTFPVHRNLPVLSFNDVRISTSNERTRLRRLPKIPKSKSSTFSFRSHKREKSAKQFDASVDLGIGTCFDALRCVIMLAEENVLSQSDCESLLPIIYSISFCYPLVYSLKSLSICFPTLRDSILERLFETVKFVLTHSPAQSKPISPLIIPVDLTNSDSIKTSLKCLTTVDFSLNDGLQNLLEQGVKPHTTHSDPSIRRKAIHTIAKILSDVYFSIVTTLYYMFANEFLSRSLVGSKDNDQTYCGEFIPPNFSSLRISSNTQIDSSSMFDSNSSNSQSAGLVSTSPLLVYDNSANGNVNNTSPVLSFSLSGSSSCRLPIKNHPQLAPVMVNQVGMRPRSRMINVNEAESPFAITKPLLEMKNPLTFKTPEQKCIITKIKEGQISPIFSTSTLSLNTLTNSNQTSPSKEIPISPVFSSDNAEIIKQCVLSCPPTHYRSDYLLLCEYTEHLINIALNDTDPKVRSSAMIVLDELCDLSPFGQTVVRPPTLNLTSFGLSSEFDIRSQTYTLSFLSILTTPRAVSALLMLSEDSLQQCRVSALHVLAKVSRLSPYAIIPSIRDTLSAHLAFFAAQRVPQPLQHIATLVESFGGALIVPLGESIVNVVFSWPQLSLDLSLGRELLSVFGALARTCPRALNKHSHRVCSYIVTLVRENTSATHASKRCLAYSALSDVIRTGFLNTLRRKKNTLRAEIDKDKDNDKNKDNDKDKNKKRNRNRNRNRDESGYNESKNDKESVNSTVWTKIKLLRFLLEQFSKEINPNVRREILWCLGVLGAIDPQLILEEDECENDRNTFGGHRRLGNKKWKRNEDKDVIKSENGNVFLEVHQTIQTEYNISHTSPDYPSLAVILSLTKVLANRTLAHHHLSATRCLVSAAQNLDKRAPLYAKCFVKSVLRVLKHAEVNQRQFFISNIVKLVNLLGYHYLPYATETIKIVCRFWDSSLISIIYHLTRAFQLAFTQDFVPISDLLFSAFLEEYKSEGVKAQNSAIALRALCLFCAVDFEHRSQVVLPLLCAVFSLENCDYNILASALEDLQMIAHATSLRRYMFPLYHALFGVLQKISLSSTNMNMILAKSVLQTLYALAQSCPQQFAFFAETLLFFLRKHAQFFAQINTELENALTQMVSGHWNPKSLTQLRCEMFERERAEFEQAQAREGENEQEQEEQEQIGTKVVNEERGLEQQFDSSERLEELVRIRQRTLRGSNRRLSLHQDGKDELLTAWECLCTSTKDTFSEYFDHFVSVVLTLSIDPFGVCKSFVFEYQPISNDLLFPALLSHYSTFSPEVRNRYFTSAFKISSMTNNANVDAVQLSLLFVDFLEHNGFPPQVFDHKMYELALKYRNYGKALYFLERNVKRNEPVLSVESIDRLITLYCELGHITSALGVLKIAQHHGVHINTRWLEALRLWDDALSYYLELAENEHSLIQTPNLRLFFAVMRCNTAMGEWENVTSLGKLVCKLLHGKPPSKLIPLLARTEKQNEEKGQPFSGVVKLNSMKESPQRVHVGYGFKDSTDPQPMTLRSKRKTQGYFGKDDFLVKEQINPDQTPLKRVVSTSDIQNDSNNLNSRTNTQNNRTGQSQLDSPPLVPSDSNITLLGLGNQDNLEKPDQIQKGGDILQQARLKTRASAQLTRSNVSELSYRRTNTHHSANMNACASISDKIRFTDLQTHIESTLMENGNESSIISENDSIRASVCASIVEAEWHLGLGWHSLTKHIDHMPGKGFSKGFFSAVVAVGQNEYKSAQQRIRESVDVLGAELATLNKETYSHMYSVIVRLQKLCELSEAIKYKQSLTADAIEGANEYTSVRSELRHSLLSLWESRRADMQHSDIDAMQTQMSTRALVISPHCDVHSWATFARLCRRNNFSRVGERACVRAGGVRVDSTLDNTHSHSQENESEQTLSLTDITPLRLEYLRCRWEAAESIQQREEVCSRFEVFVRNELVNYQDIVLRGKAMLTLYDYKHELHVERSSDVMSYSTVQHAQSMNELLRLCRQALTCLPHSARAWRRWALINSEHAQEKAERQCAHKDYIGHIVESIRALFEAVLHSSSYGIQDVLKLLTLFFKHGTHPDVESVFRHSLESFPVSAWLLVVPQLTARMHSTVSVHRDLARDILIALAHRYPQAVLYSLSVAAHTSTNYTAHPLTHSHTVSNVQRSLRASVPMLADEAGLVSHGLVALAALWPERWRVALEEASRLCYIEENVQAMKDLLKPLYALLDTGGESHIERNFYRRYSASLYKAQELCSSEQPTITNVDAAWSHYTYVYDDIGSRLTSVTLIHIDECVPALAKLSSLALAVPGSFSPTRPLITIDHFHNAVPVILSKQRPRKLGVFGSDGITYTFLLKGHEDLRLDERIMQLLVLLNGLGRGQPALRAGTYSVIPLSADAGLLEWITQADTLNNVIKHYRESKNIPVNAEHRIIEEISGGFFHSLSVIQKLECFEQAQQSTRERTEDLSVVLWKNAESSEEWISRRIRMGCSAAFMSIVGYLIGLGDRHPSNIMISCDTGAWTHIDFGDCFDVALSRDRFPEHVPFRLTRMMEYAFGVTGYEGIFRITCEQTLSLIRATRDSIISVLEAFVFEPLVNWRLPSSDSTSDESEEDSSESSESFDPLGHNFSARARSVLSKIDMKILGKASFNKKRKGKARDVAQQVQILIESATDPMNLCRCYIGWCPFW